MSDDAWLRSWFDDQDQKSADLSADPSTTDDVAEPPASQEWRHGSPPPRRSAPRRTRLAVLLGGLAILALGLIAARTAAGEAEAEQESDPPAPELVAASAPPGPARTPHDGQLADVSDRQAAVAELAVHEHVTTGDGLRWVDAARAVAAAESAGPHATVVLVDAIVLDGPPGDPATEGASDSDAPRWVDRRRARYVVPLRCATACEPLAAPWPVPLPRPGESPGRSDAAASADAALAAAGYRDAQIESTTSVHPGLDEMTVVARPPGSDGVERVVVWMRTDAQGTAVVGVP